jgi:hypothetical protein
MKVKVQLENGKFIIFEEALIENVLRLAIVESDYKDINKGYYAGYLGNFMYFEAPNDQEYLEGKSNEEIISWTKGKCIKVFHKSGRNALLRSNIKHFWVKSFLFWKQIY